MLIAPPTQVTNLATPKNNISTPNIDSPTKLAAPKSMMRDNSTIDIMPNNEAFLGIQHMLPGVIHS